MAFEEWAIIGADKENAITRHYAPFDLSKLSSMDGGGTGVSIETSGPEVTDQLRKECNRLAGLHGEAIETGYSRAAGA